MSDHRDSTALEPTSPPPGVTRRRLQLLQQLANIGCTERMVGADEMVWSDEIYELLGLVPRSTRPSLTLWRGRVHPDDQGRVDQAWSDLENGTRSRIDVSYRVANAAESWICVRETAERWQAAKESASWVVAAITPTEKGAPPVTHSEQNESLGRMAGALAHDFNNLLTAILGNCSSLLHELPPDATGRRRLTEIQGAAERGSNLVQKILAYGGCQVLTPLHLDLLHHLTELEPTLASLLGARVSLRLLLQPDLWGVSVDPKAFDQALVHLVLNAKDALAAGGTVTVRALNLESADVQRLFPEAFDGDGLLLEVGDDGGGIAAQHLPRIFDPFFTTKDGEPGAGLGLSMVQGFIHQCGGQVRVESETGGGTVVQMLLPRAGAHRMSVLTPELAAEAIPIAPSRVAAHAESPPRRILLVDDDPAVRMFLREVLEGAGHDVTDFGNPLEALSYAEQADTALDVMVTDIVMPELRGDLLAQEVLRTHRELAVVYVTGYAGSLGRRALVVPGDALLVKPFPPESLLAKVALAR